MFTLEMLKILHPFILLPLVCVFNNINPVVSVGEAVTCPQSEVSSLPDGQASYHIGASPVSCTSGFCPEGTIVEFTCDGGFTLTGSSTRTCVSEGWTESQPDCEEIRCSKSKVSLLNGEAEYSKDGSPTSCTNGWCGFETVVEFWCHSGFRLSFSESPTNRECRSAGWTGTQPICKEIRCEESEVRNLANGQALRGLDGSPLSCPGGDCLYRTVVEFSCDEGFTLTGKGDLDSRECLDDGWTKSQPTCEEITCPRSAVNSLSNGEVSYYRDGSPVSCTNGLCRFETVVKFSCSSGYTLSFIEDSTRECQSAGWTNTQPICKEDVTCSPVNMYLSNGQVFYYSNGQLLSCTNGKCPVGTVADFRCDNGFSLTGNGGSSTRECQSDGSWDGSQPRCRESTTCFLSEVNSLPNGQIDKICTCDCIDGKCAVDTVYKFTCYSGYLLTGNDGSSTRQCHTDGTWTGSQPICTEETGVSTQQGVATTTATYPKSSLTTVQEPMLTTVQGTIPPTVQGSLPPTVKGIISTTLQNQAVPTTEGGGDDGPNIVPIIVGVAVGALVLAAVIGISVCVARRRLSGPQRSRTNPGRYPNPEAPVRPPIRPHSTSHTAGSHPTHPSYHRGPSIFPTAVAINDRYETPPKGQTDKRKKHNLKANENTDRGIARSADNKSKPKRNPPREYDRDMKPHQSQKAVNPLRPVDTSLAKQSGPQSPKGKSPKNLKTNVQRATSNVYTPGQQRRYEDLGHRSKKGHTKNYDGLLESNSETGSGSNRGDYSYVRDNGGPSSAKRSHHGNSVGDSSASYDYLSAGGTSYLQLASDAVGSRVSGPTLPPR